MRSLHVFLVVVLLSGAIGCNLFSTRTDPTPRPNTPVTQVTSAQLVDYLNDRASRLKTLSGEVKFTARDGSVVGGNIGLTLHGDMTANQPRNFRMTGKGNMAGTVDLGSNSDQFWIYFEAPKPTYVFASHAAFEAGQAKLPGGIPFEPDWVMQALNMHNFPKNIQYNAAKNQSDRTYTLSWQSTTPAGLAVKKEVIFDADEVHEGRPQVKKHLVRDSKDKLLCSAEVKAVKTIALPGADPRSTQVAVQYPTHVVLRWEVQKFELDLTIENVQVNQQFPDEQARRLFRRPEYSTPAIDLAKHEFMIR